MSVPMQTQQLPRINSRKNVTRSIFESNQRDMRPEWFSDRREREKAMRRLQRELWLEVAWLEFSLE